MSNTNITIFNNQDFGSVRTIVDETGEPWFVATDIAKILDFKDAYDACRCLDSEETAPYILRVSSGNGVEQNREVKIINESGLYHLILVSRKPEAKKFRKWVTSEVLPSIRKTSGYSLVKDPIQEILATSVDQLSASRAITRLLEIEARKQQALIESNMIKDQQIYELQPKASYCDTVLNCKDVVSVTVIAKDYGMSAQSLNKLLKDRGIQYKRGNIWFLHQKYAELGLTQTKTSVHMDKYNIEHTCVHTYWTQKGRLFLYDLLKKDGILPLIERN